MKFPTGSADRGSIPLAVTFIILATGILGIVTSTVVGMLVNARAAENQQITRSLKVNAIEAIKSQQVQLVNKNGTRRCKQLDAMTGGAYVLPHNGKGTMCVEFDRQAGEGPWDGIKMSLRLISDNQTRYFAGHLSGLGSTYTTSPGANSHIDGISPADKFGGHWGFAGFSRLIAGTRGGRIGTSNPTSGTTTLGTSRLASAAFELGAPNAGRTLLLDPTTYRSDSIVDPMPVGGSCWGAGCSGSTMTQMRRVRFMPPNQSSTAEADCLYSSAAQGNESFWIASENGGVLNIPAGGLCYYGYIFDQNTTVTGTTEGSTATGNFVIAGHGGIQVNANIVVNRNATVPNARNLGIRSLGRVQMEAGSVFAGQIMQGSPNSSSTGHDFFGSDCTIRGTYYGSLACNVIDAAAATLYFQADLVDISETTATSYLEFLAFDFDETSLKEVSKTEAGF